MLTWSAASGIGYVVWYNAPKGPSATLAAMVQLSVPVFAAAGGVIFLAERISMLLIIAIFHYYRGYMHGHNRPETDTSQGNNRVRSGEYKKELSMAKRESPAPILYCTAQGILFARGYMGEFATIQCSSRCFHADTAFPQR